MTHIAEVCAALEGAQIALCDGDTRDVAQLWIKRALAALSRIEQAKCLIEADALERAAQVAHNHGRYSDAYLDGDLPDDVVIHNHACWAIRDKLRALKEQP